MYKSQSFSCRNYFCKVSVIEKRCFIAVLLSTIALLYLETEFISTMQQEKPGQMCWISSVALPKCLLVCLLMKGVTGYEEWMPSPITTVDCLLAKQSYRGKLIFWFHLIQNELCQFLHWQNLITLELGLISITRLSLSHVNLNSVVEGIPFLKSCCLIICLSEVL